MVASAVCWGQDRPLAPVDCDDKFAECKEDCAIRWGGTTNQKLQSRLNPCLNKCSGVELDCREAFFETRRNNLDEGSISTSPSSRDVDKDGLPTKTAQKKPEPKVEKREEAPVVEKKTEPAYELKKEEVPKSNRTELSKVDSKSEKPKSELKAEPARTEAAPAPREEAKKSSGLDGDVRKEDAAPAPAPAKKREEPKKEEKKKKSLDEWDPDAL